MTDGLPLGLIGKLSSVMSSKFSNLAGTNEVDVNTGTPLLPACIELLDDKDEDIDDLDDVGSLEDAVE